MRLTSAFGRPTSYLDELPEGSSRARVGSVWQADGGEAPVHPICQVLALYQYQYWYQYDRVPIAIRALVSLVYQYQQPVLVLDSIRTSHGVGVGIGFGIGNATGTSSLSDWSCSWFETLKLSLFIARTLQVFLHGSRPLSYFRPCAGLLNVF